MEARWASESELHPLAGFIVLDDVTDRAVPAGGTYLESSVQAHGRPLTAGPEPIIGAGQGIDQLGDHCWGCGNSSLMHVEDHGGQDTGGRWQRIRFSGGCRAVRGFRPGVHRAFSYGPPTRDCRSGYD